MAILTPLLIVMLIPNLGRVPRAFGDDSWSQAMAAYTLAYEGVPRNPGQMGRGGVDQYLLEPRLFGSVVGAGVYRLLGFGLTQGRLVAVLASVIFTFAVYGAMRQLFGPRQALAISALTIVDPWVFLTSRTYRPEMPLAALLWLGTSLLLAAALRRGSALAVAGGLCAGLALWTHPGALVFIPAGLLAAAYASRRQPSEASAPRRLPTPPVGRASDRSSGVWRWAAPRVLVGFAVGLTPYLVYVGWVQQHTNLSMLAQVGERAAAPARPLETVVMTEIARWSNFLQLPTRAPLALLLAAALLRAIWRGTTAERALAVWIVAAAVCMPVVQSVGTGRYLVVLVPAFAALVWRGVLELMGPRQPAAAAVDGAKPRQQRSMSAFWRRARPATAGAVLAGYVLFSGGPIAAMLYAHRYADYDAWCARVAALVPRGARVMGHSMFWTGLHDRRFISSIPPYFDEWRSEADAVAHLRAHRPTYVLQASLFYPGIGGLGPQPADLRGTVWGRACELLALEVPAEVLDEFYHRDFGSVRIWRMDWPAATSQADTPPS